MARLRARRSGDSPGRRTADTPDVLTFGDVSRGFPKYEARKSGQSLDMSRKEFGILRHLASKAGDVVTRDELLDVVWGHDQFPHDPDGG